MWLQKISTTCFGPVPTTQDEAMLKVILDGIVHDANIFPVYDDMSDKAEVSESVS